jgi:hypothetical protein
MPSKSKKQQNRKRNSHKGALCLKENNEVIATELLQSIFSGPNPNIFNLLVAKSEHTSLILPIFNPQANYAPMVENIESRIQKNLAFLKENCLENNCLSGCIKHYGGVISTHEDFCFPSE